MNSLNISSVKEREILPGLRARFVHSATMTFAYWSIDRGAALPEHHHPHEQVVHMLEGEFEIRVEGEAQILSPGTVVVIPGNARHSGRAITDCRILDVFHPVREDYLESAGEGWSNLLGSS